MEGSYTNDHDITLEAIEQILPQIQQEIRQKLKPELEEEMLNEFNQQQKQLERQGEQEYQEALRNLNEERQKLEQQKLGPLQTQLEELLSANQQKQSRQLAQLQDKFLLANFNQKILKHPLIQKLQVQLEEELFQQQHFSQKFESLKSRKMKEIAIELQQKEERYKRQKDKALKKKQYAESGIQELKNDIQLLKVAIASMKSDYNVKIRKIDNDIKTDKKNILEFQNKEDLETLKERLAQLERAKMQRDQQQQNADNGLNQNSEEESSNMLFNFNTTHTQQSSNRNNNSLSGNFNTFDQRHMENREKEQIQKEYIKKDKKMQMNFLLNSFSQQANLENQIKYVNQDVVIESSSDDDQSSIAVQDRRTICRQQTLLHPPATFVRSQHLNTENSDTSNFQALLKGPIIGLNISSLLRQRWEQRQNEDPLGRYLTKDSYVEPATYNENNSKIQNCNERSQFYQQYQTHLRRLGGNYDPRVVQPLKSRKLSANARQTIIKNIAANGFGNR